MSPEPIIADAIDRAMVANSGRSRTIGPLVVGLCGPQGSGKSTIAAALVARFTGAVTLSLDDIYKTREERRRMAREVHPLFATRGVPGTHDVPLGLATIAALDRGEATTLPRFDKARDDRRPRDLWPTAAADCALLILEGWCVGARPERPEDLILPINALERDEDAQGAWRRHANSELQAYQALFERIDLLVLLSPPSFETVVGWRIQQERKLRSIHGDAVGVMDDGAVVRFVSHYERLTRHIMAEMPGRADLHLSLSANRTLNAGSQA